VHRRASVFDSHVAPVSGAKQSGAILPIFVLGLVVMLGLAGLALDGGHGMLNKTRLQNAVDAAALSAAKTLDETSDWMLAHQEAIRMFEANANAAGNRELAAADVTVEVQFSEALIPFVPGATTGARYVRVRVTDFTLPAWFIRVMGFNEKVVGATAIAGPSPSLINFCDIVPIMVCGDPDKDLEDHFGYEPGLPYALKMASLDGSDIGPGNFHLIRMGDSGGDSELRDNLAGNFDGCADLSEAVEVDTSPGNKTGPVAQGLNTRLGIYQGPVSADDYPPDVVVNQVCGGTSCNQSERLTYDDATGQVHFEGQPILTTEDAGNYYNYVDYLNEPVGSWVPGGVAGRRILATAVGNCSGSSGGSTSVELRGVVCFHMLQQVSQQGTHAQVFGEFLDPDQLDPNVAGIPRSCRVTGRPGPSPGSGPGPYIIQLYKDPDAVDA
jgi:hypothetical protein